MDHQFYALAVVLPAILLVFNVYPFSLIGIVSGIAYFILLLFSEYYIVTYPIGDYDITYNVWLTLAWMGNLLPTSIRLVDRVGVRFHKETVPPGPAPQTPQEKSYMIKEILSDAGHLPPEITTALIDVLSRTSALNQNWNRGRASMEATYIGEGISELKKFLPPFQLVSVGGGYDQRQWNDYYQEAEGKEEDTYVQYKIGLIPGDLLYDILAIRIKIKIPEPLRAYHHQIIGSSGHGKSQCMTNMILDDLKEDASIVVIETKGDLVNSLAPRVPQDRLILVDPVTCPPALNIFANKHTDVEGALELYEYIFRSLDVEMTGPQTSVYSFLCRLCMSIPGATLFDLYKMTAKGGLAEYEPYISQMDYLGQRFFADFGDDKSPKYRETKPAIERRLELLLQNASLSGMLCAKENRLALGPAMDTGKVILISTAKPKLKETASTLLGRIFFAQIMEAVRARPDDGKRKTTYLYIDEFQNYAEDTPIVTDLFDEMRSYGLRLIVAHHKLDQLPGKLGGALSTHAAIKFAGGVSYEDAGPLAGQLNSERNVVFNQKQFHFVAYFKNIGTVPYSIEVGRIDKVPKVAKLKDIQARMRKEYGPRTVPVEPPAPRYAPEVTRTTERTTPSPTPPQSAPKEDAPPPAEPTDRLREIIREMEASQKAGPAGGGKPPIKIHVNSPTPPKPPASPSSKPSPPQPDPTVKFITPPPDAILPPPTPFRGKNINPDDVDEVGPWP